MKTFFDLFFGFYTILTLVLTALFASQAFGYPPYIVMVLIAQAVVILIPYSLIWVYFRERIVRAYRFTV